MLIEYRVRNYLSFKDEIVLSMVAESSNEHEDTNVAKIDDLRLLKSVAIFGSNASGKTNLLDSIEFLNYLLMNGISENGLRNLPTFKLDIESRNKPIRFEITFLLNKIQHRYELEISNKGIIYEALYFYPKRYESLYFEIIDDKIIKTGVYFKEKIHNLIKPDKQKPFLSILAQKSINGFDWAKEVYDCITTYTLQLLPDEVFKSFLEHELLGKDSFLNTKLIIELIKNADIGINDIAIKELDEADEILDAINNEAKNEKDDEYSIKKTETYFYHSVFRDKEEQNEKQPFSINQESAGTIKLFSMLYPILLTLQTGGILYIDEIENSLHSSICKSIISWFNNKEINKSNAQIIFTSHNLLLMRSELFRRDQIYFTEKDKYGVSTLYSLYDFNVGKDYNYVNNYLAGRFGAVPYLRDFYPEILSTIE